MARPGSLFGENWWRGIVSTSMNLRQGGASRPRRFRISCPQCITLSPSVATLAYFHQQYGLKVQRGKYLRRKKRKKDNNNKNAKTKNKKKANARGLAVKMENRIIHYPLSNYKRQRTSGLLFLTQIIEMAQI